MGKQITEEILLKKLDIPDFRYMTKDKVIQFASMLEKMDPEVAKKVLEQFPEFANAIKENVLAFKEEFIKVMSIADESTKNLYASDDKIIDALLQLLDKKEISEEDRKYILDKIVELQKLKHDKDSEFKKFLLSALVIAGTIVGGTITVAAAVLGSGNSSKD